MIAIFGVLLNNKAFEKCFWCFSIFAFLTKMRLQFYVCMLFHLMKNSENRIIISNYKYSFNSNYMHIEFVIFNNSVGGYSYNATKTFLTNLVLSVTVSALEISNYCRFIERFQDHMLMEVARPPSNKFEKVVNYAIDHCQRNKFFGSFLSKMLWKDAEKYTTRNNSYCPFSVGSTQVTNSPLSDEYIPKIFPQMQIHLNVKTMAKIFKQKKFVQIFEVDVLGEYLI